MNPLLPNVMRGRCLDTHKTIWFDSSKGSCLSLLGAKGGSMRLFPRSRPFLSLAFRGYREYLETDEGTKNSGNSTDLFKLIAKFDPMLREYKNRIDSKELAHHYLSHDIQNELITIMSNTGSKITDKLNSENACLTLVAWPSRGKERRRKEDESEEEMDNMAEEDMAE
ncbi:TTF-type domain-containing protein [Trichonephila clavipes]|nr:TTF-type domain-containing protein [Trichonephila clavipes]